MAGRAPVLIATEAIMKDALANEEALSDKAKKLKTGQLISIKDLVPKADWDKIVKKTNDALIVSAEPTVCTQVQLDEFNGKKPTLLNTFICVLLSYGKPSLPTYDVADFLYCLFPNGLRACAHPGGWIVDPWYAIIFFEYVEAIHSHGHLELGHQRRPTGRVAYLVNQHAFGVLIIY
jgi:hypothetical protein